MALRWLHKTWKTFWTIVGIGVAALFILAVVCFVVLQFPATKNYLTQQLEQQFNASREAKLSIGGLDGRLPFNLAFSDISIYSDSTYSTPIFTSDSLVVVLNWRGLFRNEISISALTIFDPTIEIDLQRPEVLASLRKQGQTQTKGTSMQLLPKPDELDVIIPSVVVKNGSVLLRNFEVKDSLLINSDSLSFTNLQLDMYFEYSPLQRVVDIEELRFDIPEARISKMQLFGQLFNDSRYLELNAFRINTTNAYAQFSGRIDGINIFKADLERQIKEAIVALNIKELFVKPEHLRKIFPAIPDVDQVITLSVQTVGRLDSLAFDNLNFGVGNSGFNGYGLIKLADDIKPLEYRLMVEEVFVDSADIYSWFHRLDPKYAHSLASLQVDGELLGDLDKLKADIAVSSQYGAIQLQGETTLETSPAVAFDARLDSLNLGELFHKNLQETILDGTVHFRTNSLVPDTAQGELRITLADGAINKFQFDSLMVQGQWEQGIYQPSYRIISETSALDGSGRVNLKEALPVAELTGSARHFDLKALTQLDELNNTVLDLEYEFYASGQSLDDGFGQLTIDIPQSIIGTDTVSNHQIYADYSTHNGITKTFRVTSNILDITVDGTFDPRTLPDYFLYWANYLKKQVHEEILFTPSAPLSNVQIDTTDQQLDIQFTLKDYSLLNAYWPKLPRFNSNVELNSEWRMNRDRILFTATINDPNISYKGYGIDSLSMQVTGSFRADETLKSFSGLQLLATASTVKSEFVEANGVHFQLEMDEDSIYLAQNIDHISSDTQLNTELKAALDDSTVTININNFTLGNAQYQWMNTGTPTLKYHQNGALAFTDFLFTNNEELLQVEGIFSGASDDSVNYDIRNVNLGRVSDLINGRIDFSGTLDGRFTTKSLTRLPTIQGELGITGLAIDERVVGDITLTSRLNTQLQRFDTRIIVATDSAKYPSYFTRNERMGQNIVLDGYLLAPQENGFPEVDSLFYFDLNFESIDLWILPFIAPRVFTEMSGIASGKGSIWGNLNDFDYHVDYQVGVDDAVFIRPRFLDTYYFAQGMLTLDKSQGLNFHDLFVIDPSGGTAIVSGTYNLGHLGPVHTMDLTMRMNEFQFLNSSFDPDVPFFGDAYGTATIRLTGTNLNPVLTTESPVYISDFSNIGIPLLEETEFDEDNKFIRFVDDFDSLKQKPNGDKNTSVGSAVMDQEDPFNRSFAERFTLDLQFIAEQPMTVQLIFDPVTGDIIQTTGTGRLGIRLQDEEFSMFGQFNISGGTYNFVSGEIFTRRFKLESGGTIIWDGAPSNARLNLNAIYEARPDINTLTQARSDLDSESSQRVPVQLVLNVGGSLSAIENNFFFRLPNTFEARQNSTINTQINALNRNEDEKLIQAASFLLMGDFIPSATASTNAPNSIASNFSGSGAVLNPLLSNQVISPLLSNQINSLLRSDIGSLDIDFNLNTYNNVDLGVALRLYNDRIILSREGQITGSQSNIGDLGATYRINQTLSVTAFHRQDPTFSNITGGEETQQAQDINGLGLEAEISFNTWHEFFRKLISPFRRLFARKEANTEEELVSNN